MLHVYPVLCKVLLWATFIGGFSLPVLYACVFAYMAFTQQIVSYTTQKRPAIMGFYVLCGLVVNVAELVSGYPGFGDAMLLSILACLYSISRLKFTHVMRTVRLLWHAHRSHLCVSRRP